MISLNSAIWKTKGFLCVCWIAFDRWGKTNFLLEGEVNNMCLHRNFRYCQTSQDAKMIWSKKNESTRLCFTYTIFESTYMCFTIQCNQNTIYLENVLNNEKLKFKCILVFVSNKHWCWRENLTLCSVDHLEGTIARPVFKWIHKAFETIIPLIILLI